MGDDFGAYITAALIITGCAFIVALMAVLMWNGPKRPRYKLPHERIKPIRKKWRYILKRKAPQFKVVDERHEYGRQNINNKVYGAGSGHIQPIRKVCETRRKRDERYGGHNY